MRALGVALVVSCAAALLPSAARAEPIALSLESTTGGATAGGSGFTTGWFAMDLGTLTLPTAQSSATIFVDGLKHGSDYTVTFTVTGVPRLNPWDTLTAEVLDPLSDGFDDRDADPQPGYVPAGYSTSATIDGLSFAQDSGMTRSATFARGGTAGLFVDEVTDARDLLQFSGFRSGDTARVTFGLRDRLGSRGFLLRLSVNGRGSAASPVANPEPASLLLLGTGLAGLVRARWRRAA
jgi:hypothetical protein